MDIGDGLRARVRRADARGGTMTGAQEFEKVLDGSDTSVASFETRERLADQARAAFPALDAGGGAADRAGAVDRHLRRHHRRTVLLVLHADADPAADRHRRHPRRGPDPGHPDRRHRSFGRRHHGDLRGRHGQFRRHLRHAGADRHARRPGRRRRCAACSTASSSPT